MKSPNSQVKEKLKIVQLMDCDPGLDRHKKKMVMLRLAHLGEIEMPLMLTLWDAKRLVAMLLIALETHGDAAAGHLHDLLVAGRRQPRWAEEGDPAVGKWPKR